MSGNGTISRPDAMSIASIGSGPMPRPSPSSTAWRVTKKWSNTCRGWLARSPQHLPQCGSISLDRYLFHLGNGSGRMCPHHCFYPSTTLLGLPHPLEPAREGIRGGLPIFARDLITQGHPIFAGSKLVSGPDHCRMCRRMAPGLHHQRHGHPFDRRRRQAPK
jgi:hypothetical protein